MLEVGSGAAVAERAEKKSRMSEVVEIVSCMLATYSVCKVETVRGGL